jgi:hydroxyacylglutathione hydrolase
MILKQYYLGCLAHASYLVGDQSAGTAVVVDPQRDVGQYLDDASRMGMRIRHVFLTHFHADFVAGHLELRDRAGARIHLGARAEAEFGFEPARDGDALEFGSVRLSILETPGHTPEMISIVVTDLAGNPDRPHAVLTGDALFIGDVGRPDLLASFGHTAEELAGMLYDSLHGKLLRLPDETLVYPAHGAGSMCGKKLGQETVSTIGIQRRTNYALQPMTRERFVRLVTADQSEAPAYFSYDAALNRKERETLERSMEKSLRALSLDETLRFRVEGAQIVDVREPHEFAGAHLGGSVNLPLQGRYATYSGMILRRDRPIVIVAEPGAEVEGVMRLGRIGFDHVVGYLRDSMRALADRPDEVREQERIAPVELAAELAGAAPSLVLDVRTEAEHAGRRIEGSLNIPLHRLEERLAEVPRGRRIVTQCRTGYRSSVAASLLRRAGIDTVADLIGGIEAWEVSTVEA